MGRIATAKAFVSHQFSDWKASHYVLDGAVSLGLTLIIGWVFQMPWYIGMPLFVCIVLATTCAFMISRDIWKALKPSPAEQTADNTQYLSDRLRLEMAERKIYDIIRMIPLYTMNDDERMELVGYVPAPSDWKTETKNALRAIAKPDICADYERLLKSKAAERSAIVFLQSLVATLTIQQLR